MSPAPRAGWGFVLAWIAASGVGMGIAGTLARPLSYAVGGLAEAGGPALVEAVIGLVAGGGALGGMALGQWFVLRRRLDWAARWPASLAAAGAVGAAAGYVADELLAPGAPPPVPLAVGAAAFVVAQWLVLRAVAPCPWRLSLLTAASFVIAAAGTAAIALFVGLEGPSPLFAALMGCLFGTATAAFARPSRW